MKESYAGKIKNAGSQRVEAIFSDRAKGKSNVKKGDDLRMGSEKGSGKKQK